METIKRFPVASVTDIQIKSTLSQVNIIPGNEQDIILRWTDTKRRTTSAELEGTMLTVKSHAEIALYGIVGLISLKKNKELTLELPDGFCGSVQIESNDECVRVLGVNCAAILRVKTLVAAIDVSSSELQSCDLASQGGTVTLHGITTQKGISVTTNSGNVECLCGESADNYLLDCHSEHGVCNLPPSFKRGKKYLRIHSKIGTITVNFTGED